MGRGRPILRRSKALTKGFWHVFFYQLGNTTT